MSHLNIHNFLNVLSEVQAEVYITVRSVRTFRILKTSKRAIIRKKYVFNKKKNTKKRLLNK